MRLIKIMAIIMIIIMAKTDRFVLKPLICAQQERHTFYTLISTYTNSRSVTTVTFAQLHCKDRRIKNALRIWHRPVAEWIVHVGFGRKQRKTCCSLSLCHSSKSIMFVETSWRSVQCELKDCQSRLVSQKGRLKWCYFRRHVSRHPTVLIRGNMNNNNMIHC